MISTPAQEFLEFPAAVSFLALLTPEDVASLFKQRVSTLENTLAHLEDQFQKGASLGLPRLFLLEAEYQQKVLEAEWNGFQKIWRYFLGFTKPPFLNKRTLVPNLVE